MQIACGKCRFYFTTHDPSRPWGCSKFNFKSKNSESRPEKGFEYGENGYENGKLNIGFNDKTGQIHIEVNGLTEPKSKEAKRICENDLNELIATFVQDKTTAERGLFDEEIAAQDLTQIKMGKVVKDKYPELDSEDQEAIRQHAIAAINLTQKGKENSAPPHAPWAQHAARHPRAPWTQHPHTPRE